MKYQKEFEAELKLFINDCQLINTYSKEEVEETLQKYWSNKDIDTCAQLFPPEHYDKINKYIEDFKKLNPQQKKTYLQVMIKKLKYKGII